MASSESPNSTHGKSQPDWAKWVGALVLAALFIAGLGVGLIIGLTQDIGKHEYDSARRDERDDDLDKSVPTDWEKTNPRVKPPEPKSPDTPSNTPETKPTPPNTPDTKLTPPSTPDTKPSPPITPDTKPKEPVVQVKFKDKIQSIFESKCIGCHGDSLVKGGLDLRTLASTLKGGDSGVAVKPGDPADSELWKQIDGGSMPPPKKKQLSENEKKLIKMWIESGAK